MAYSDPYTWVTGDVLTADQLNVALYEDMRQIAEPAAVSFWNQQDIAWSPALSTNSFPEISLENMWRPNGSQNYYIDTAGSDTGIVLQQTGWWAVGISLWLDGTTAAGKGTILFTLEKGGVYIGGKTVSPTCNGSASTNRTDIGVMCIVDCHTVPSVNTPGDKLTWDIWTGGEAGTVWGQGPNNLKSGNHNSPFFWAYRIGPL